MPARYSSSSGIILFTLPVVPDGVPEVQPEASRSSVSSFLSVTPPPSSPTGLLKAALECLFLPPIVHVCARKKVAALGGGHGGGRWAAGRGRCGRVVKSVVKRAAGSCS